MFFNNGDILLSSSLALASSSALSILVLSNQKDIKPVLPTLLMINLFTSGFTEAALNINQNSNYQLLSRTVNNLGRVSNALSLSFLVISSVILVTRKFL